MNLKTIIVSATAVVVVVEAAIECRKVTIVERKKREEIRLEHEKEIAAIRTASQIVIKNIHAGAYTNLEQVLNDQKFYRMAARFED